MLGRAIARPRTRSEAEKPFWISYADLMTAMMVLFLVAMAITIFALRESIERPIRERTTGIRSVCADLNARLKSIEGIRFECDEERNRIQFGEAGRFALNSYELPQEAGRAIASMVPAILDVAATAEGEKWMSRVVVEGFTDPVGGYLYNLNLSLQRSGYVMCLLMDPMLNRDLALTPEQLARVRSLFAAGGVSFNDQRDSDEESRRVEMRIEFYPLDASGQGAKRTPIDVVPDRCRL
jgi:flagellar motor protein MotB